MSTRTPTFLFASFAAVAFAQLAAGEAEAAKEKFERTKPHVNVGTIGHVPQGQTSMTTRLPAVAVDTPARRTGKRTRR